MKIYTKTYEELTEINAPHVGVHGMTQKMPYLHMDFKEVTTTLISFERLTSNQINLPSVKKVVNIPCELLTITNY